MVMSRERTVAILRTVCLLTVVPVSVSFLNAQSAPSSAASAYTSVTDPLEHAFTVSVPAGWQTQAGLARRAALQINPYVRSLSPDKMTYLLIGEPTLPSFTPPSPMRNTIGLTEGKVYNGGLGGLMLVLRYLPGTEFARTYGETALGGLCTNFQFTSVQDRPDLARIAASAWPTPVPSREDGGEAKFTCTHHGQKMEVRVDAATRIDNTGIGWNVILLDALIAPASSADAAASTLEHIMGSVQFSPAWIQMQNKLDAQAAAAINANMQQYFRQERSFMQQLNAEDTAFDSMDAIINDESLFIDESTGRIVACPRGQTPEWGSYVPLQRAP